MRNNNLVKNKRGRNIAIGGTLFITIIIVFFLFIFNNKVNTEIEDIGLNYITDISKEIDANLEIELSKSLNYVKGIAISLSNLDTNFSQYSLNYIDKVSSFTNFDDLFIIDINGIGRKSDGTKINLSDREYFKDAMKGNIGVSDHIVSRINNKEEVVVYAPIYINGNIEGVLAGTYMIEEYTSIAKKAIFKGEGFVEIFSADGNYISKSKHKNSLMSEWDNMWNFFKSVEFEEGYSYETLHQDITEGKSGQIRYKIYGKERIAHYMPMDIKDWYTFVIIPKEAIGEYTGNINNTMSFLLAFILISFIILIVIVILYELKVRKELVKINEEVKISKERFAIAINLTGSLVIEYDIEKKSILHFSEKSEEYGIKKDEEVTLEKLLSLGIFDDEYIRDAENIFRRIEEGDEMSVGVVKAKKKDGRSCWVKISFTTLYDSNGKPIKGIGTLEDITDSKVIELLYLQEEQNRIAIMADTVETYIFDVTENKFLYGFRNNGERFEQNNKSYDSIINKVAKENIYKEDKELFLSAFKRENIKKEFSEGKVKIAIEYRKGTKEDFKWFEGIINLFLDSESGNLLGGLYVRDINEKKSKEISLRYDAERDQLTGIYNRRMTENSITDTLKDNSERRVHALFSIDLDGFKSVNDSHGHMIGDELLIEMARELRGILRKGDILGRMGGDEFIILLKDIKDKKQIELKANEICNTLRSLKIIKRENLNVSGSVGISISPMDGTNFSELYKKADEALYVAKNAGKDQYVIYDDSIRS